jgi:hypothetical protein
MCEDGTYVVTIAVSAEERGGRSEEKSDEEKPKLAGQQPS